MTVKGSRGGVGFRLGEASGSLLETLATVTVMQPTHVCSSALRFDSAHLHRRMAPTQA
jgi:hypothetical protein